MRKIIMMLSFALCTVAINAQERIDRPDLKFEKSSQVLTEATGWIYNKSSGKWMENLNTITTDKPYSDSKRAIEYMRSRSSSTFNKLQIKTITYNNTPYYILVMERWAGSYKYPSIQKDWQTGIRNYAYIISEEEYNKLRNIQNSIEVLVEGDVYIYEYDETKLLDEIQNELIKIDQQKALETPKKKKQKNEEKKGRKMLFLVTKSTEGQIRFKLPMTIYGSAPDFSQEYYETAPENFSKLIIPNT
ncbi:hypothetical protein HYN59_14095 [Flavobacterium album]|uniref:Uncharacterized protein n=1 Tax=Flavobacterium album TaxID=2175091 RepID=A0A2S1R0R9_9FLAO|nr:hypothetical protein [Flavobacterium album]AWH86169.1 hypothetical protein HYN59_14095 [Flavobacterium album]